MTTHDLLEQASLDALGLLDADEREAFEQAFRAAPPALQAQIRREQLRISQIDGLLPQVELPLGLRARVMSALREAMQKVTLRRTAVESGDVLATLRPSVGVNRLWRASALGAVAATLVLGFATLQLRRDYNELTERWTSNVMSDAFNEFGPKFASAAFSPETKFIQFVAGEGVPGTAAGKALLLIEPKSGRVQLYTKDLPSGSGMYELVAVEGDGTVSERGVIATFTNSPDGINREEISRLAIEGLTQLAIRRVGESQLLLVSVRL